MRIKHLLWEWLNGRLDLPAEFPRSRVASMGLGSNGATTNASGAPNPTSTQPPAQSAGYGTLYSAGTNNIFGQPSAAQVTGNPNATSFVTVAPGTRSTSPTAGVAPGTVISTQYSPYGNAATQQQAPPAPVTSQANAPVASQPTQQRNPYAH